MRAFLGNPPKTMTKVNLQGPNVSKLQYFSHAFKIDGIHWFILMLL